ncbi:hypothetical protein PR202_ga11040 [Eleusine coracana subsp. coracana]|uniref:Alpha/beta hydrolase fold-3 domain-containing protein n=1 Tax=Eleusine coracana subsp. coracana TaxID=191504 RepID=A0AAV5C8I4_ELECO|nr:hypothetical protein PR202_ga11040 [Eleusine coracana subsp. coracana]
MTMHSNERSGGAGTTMEEAAGAGAEIADDLSPFLRKYKDGRIERLVTHTFVPASETPAANGVATRDVVIDRATGVSARLFLNVRAVTTSGRRLPVVVYFHGGGFCTGSAFSKLFHRYAASLSARAAALVVSVDYRLAPEHPVPAAFDDAWAALRWVTTFAFADDDPWIARHADRDRLFLAGESAGAVIAHDVASRAASTDGLDIDIVGIEGMILLQPFFWGPDRLPSETDDDDDHHRRQHKTVFVPEKLDKFWPFLTGGPARNGGDPRADPPAEAVASVACRRALVAVASMDLARHRGRRYAAWLQRHGRWCREVTFVESEGEDHAFHLYRPARATAVELMDSVVEFVSGGGERTPAPALPEKETVVVVETPVMMNLHATVGAYDDTLLANGSGNKKIIRVSVTPPRWSVARSALVVGPGNAASVPLSHPHQPTPPLARVWAPAACLRHRLPCPSFAVHGGRAPPSSLSMPLPSRCWVDSRWRRPNVPCIAPIAESRRCEEVAPPAGFRQIRRRRGSSSSKEEEIRDRTGRHRRSCAGWPPRRCCFDPRGEDNGVGGAYPRHHA